MKFGEKNFGTKHSRSPHLWRSPPGSVPPPWRARAAQRWRGAPTRGPRGGARGLRRRGQMRFGGGAGAG